MTRLPASAVALVRADVLVFQEGRCAVCGLPCEPEEAVLDHDHATGCLRGVLHRGCNSLLGKLENNWKRYRVPSLDRFVAGVLPYLEAPQAPTLHPTHRTEEEKRQRRNALARKRRAAARANPKATRSSNKLEDL